MAVKRNKSRKATPKVTPPGLTPLQKILLDEAGRKVTITSEGRQQEVSIEQVVTRKLLQVAASGSVHALSNAVNEIILAQRIMQREIEEDIEFAHRVKAHQQVLLDKARKEGQDLNTVLPHPDDIEIIPGVGYKVHGPWDEAELKIVLGNCARRDLYILQAALEERLGEPESDQNSGGRDKQFPGASALVLVHFFNDGLPARFHKSDMQLIADLYKCRRLTKRDLLKITHQEWAAIGSPKPRGWRMPSLRKTCADLERVTEGCIELLHEMMAGQIMSDREISARLRQLQR
ncbi:hypothetical protein [Hoeflea sp. AS16]|uniref:hypothetical protein n=1 Tax=Hoeflea sp. AS16 TaxID=3135779 RepID=UPI00317B1049